MNSLIVLFILYVCICTLCFLISFFFMCIHVCASSTISVIIVIIMQQRI